MLVLENKKSRDLIEELRRRKYDPDPVKVWKLTQDKDALLDEVAGQNVDEEEQEQRVVASRNADFDYLLDMAIRSLTFERKEELLKRRDAKMTEYELLRAKTAPDLWRNDLDIFMEKLQETEDAARQLKDKGPIKKEKKPLPMLGKKTNKKNLVAEVLPSPKGRRIAPIIDPELRKKVEKANQAKETKAKKALNKSPGADVAHQVEKDSFDLDDDLNRSLSEKLGLPSPSKGAKKKTAAKKPTADAMKQTKLNFGPKKAKKKISDDEDDGHDLDNSGDSDKDEFDMILDQAPLRFDCFSILQ